MRDSNYPNTPDAESEAQLALARSTLPDAVAPHYAAPPQMIGWRSPDCLWMLQPQSTGLYILQYFQDAPRQTHVIIGAAWNAYWQSLTPRQRLQSSAQLDAAGNYLYVNSNGQVWQIAIDADGVPGTPRMAQYMPLRLPQHGHELSMPLPRMGLVCPRGKYCVRVEKDNLLLQDLENGTERYLTCNGSPESGYGSPLYFGLQVGEDGAVARPLIASWSPDGRYLLSYKLDYRACHRRQLIKMHADGQEQLLRWPEVMTGQTEHIPLAQLWLFDIHTQRALPLALPENLAATRFEFYDADYATHFFLQQISWQPDGLYLLPWARGRRAAALYRTDLESGNTQQIHLETSSSNLDYPMLPGKCLLAQGQVFWLSEKDGWSHIYQVQGGQMQQLTSGAWAVRALLACDAAQEYLYFLAGGREAGLDPYYRQLYRLHLPSGRVTRLTQEDADHEVQIAPDCRSFADSHARHDAPPHVVWRRSDGSLLQNLGVASFDTLLASGWQPPQAVQVTARDGVSDMHGLLYTPRKMQKGRRYPVIISVYPGCHTFTVPKRLEALGNHMFFMASLAALDCYVLRIDGMGGPGRSKAWHDVCFRNLGDASLPDQVHALQQLAKRHTQMDLDRVAMIGSSGGGYATARAMLCYPDVFKVGVAAAGNHDPMLEGAEWTEDYGGWPLDHELLHAHSNVTMAAQMHGRLLLLHGALDDNVSVTQSLRLGAALVREQKQVDMLILPDADHAAIGRPDAQEYVWRYLQRNL